MPDEESFSASSENTQSDSYVYTKPRDTKPYNINIPQKGVAYSLLIWKMVWMYLLTPLVLCHIAIRNSRSSAPSSGS
ncbi:unnamed protein product [Nezara viridula]|uniref:Uncharacterized protein n=1 Tax=Nezara viridula TaxID=85310 RepID=A0A9P0MX10_NEZVI|nr:unnamed protein product [Nezara viridula]